MKRPKKVPYKIFKLTVFFTVTFFIVSLMTWRSVSFLTKLLKESQLLVPEHVWSYVATAVYSLVGTIIALIWFKKLIVPLYRIYSALDEVTDGNFNVKLKPEGIKTVRKLARKFNKMTDELGSVETLRNDFISDFSHEFKTPIVSVEGFAKILRDDSSLSEAEKKEYLDIIISESGRLAELSTNILNLSRLEKQSLLTDMSTFNVSEQIRLAVVLLDKKWAEKEIGFNLDCEELSIRASEEILSQLWINLIDNAIKFSQKGGRIFITAKKRGQKLVFTFTDEGEGISEHKLKRIFDKFYQGDDSHFVSGNGIGLPIAKRICELHDGSIDVVSSEGEGTVFTVELPA